MPYSITLAPPVAYWDPIHRPVHFQSFAAPEADIEADIDDNCEFARRLNRSWFSNFSAPSTDSCSLSFLFLVA